jgi:hypothetical protein
MIWKRILYSLSVLASIAIAIMISINAIKNGNFNIGPILAALFVLMLINKTLEDTVKFLETFITKESNHD